MAPQCGFIQYLMKVEVTAYLGLPPSANRADDTAKSQYTICIINTRPIGRGH